MRAHRLSALAVTTVLGLTLAGCGGDSDEAPYDDGVIKIGVVGTTPVNEALVEKAEEEGITVELVELSEYSQVNPATVSGDVDMNWFQHIAYLADYNNSSGETVTPIASTSISTFSRGSTRAATPSVEIVGRAPRSAAP